jgi:transcriptional regulator with XRE-family HTH domain
MQTPIGILNPLTGLQAPDGAELVSLRMRHGLTQSAAGQLIGIKGKDWSRYECGLRRMPVATWACVLLALGEHPRLAVVARTAVL